MRKYNCISKLEHRSVFNKFVSILTSDKCGNNTDSTGFLKMQMSILTALLCNYLLQLITLSKSQWKKKLLCGHNKKWQQWSRISQGMSEYLIFFFWDLNNTSVIIICEKYYFGHCGGGGLVTESCPSLVTQCMVAHQAPLSMGFSRQGKWGK